MLQTKEKFKNIEFLRFIFAIGICFLHLVRRNYFKNSSDVSLQHLYEYVKDANKLVDFFFVIAGFFLFYHIKKDLSISDFSKNRLSRLWPNMFFAFLCLWILSLFGILRWDTEVAFSSLFFINNIIVVPYNHTLNVLWFIISLFWVSIFYFSIAKNFKNNIVSFIILLITFSSYRILNQTNTNIAEHNNNLFFTTELLRGLGGIGIGYFISLIDFSQLNKIYNIHIRLIVTTIELFLYWFLFKYMFYAENHLKITLLLLIAFCVLFILAILKIGYISCFFEKKWSVFLGKYAFSIYCTHQLINQIAEQYIFYRYSSFISEYICSFVILVIGISFIFGVFTYHFVEVPAAKLMKKWLFPAVQNNEGGN